MGVPGTLIIEQTRERRNVIVKNISTTGVSFVVESLDVDTEDIRDFRLEFEDVQNRLNIILHGRVVREEVCENKKVFGAALKTTNVNLSTYIAQKQKQDMAKKRGK